jgi:phosphoglycerol transferase MdoB-like AlkP superfamily enzyme
MDNINDKTNRFQIYNIDYQLRLLFRILVLLILYSISRIVFYFYNIEFFPDIDFSGFMRIMLGGLRFDLSSILFLNSLYIFLYLIPHPFRYRIAYQVFIKWIFYLTNGLALALNTADFFYFEFILKRSTVDVFIFAKEKNILSLLGILLIDYWRGVVFWIILLTFLITMYRKFKVRKPRPFKRVPFYSSSLAWLIISLYFCFIGIQGGFSSANRPISVGSAGAYTDKPLEMAIVLNTPFTIIRTLHKKTLHEKNYYSDQELDGIYSPVHLPQMTKEFLPLNVVVLVIESMAKEYVGALNKNLNNGEYQGYTKFLDSLIQHSKTFQWSFANCRNSIDALPSIVSSVPSLVLPYLTSNYAANDITSIASLLRQKGYESAFFHGAPNGSMGFDAFVRVAGYEKYFGLSEYGKETDYDGSWGIWDEEFLLYMVDEINTFKEPFHATFLSVSSHHPFKVPEKYKDRFREGTLGLHIPVQYADLALRLFFEKASKQTWFKNTLFVITADHSNQAWHDEYKTPIGDFSIPIVFYHPGNPAFKGIDSSVVQQMDILPSVMGYLNYDKKFIAFGNNIFSDDRASFAVNYNNNTYQFIKGNYILQFLEEKTIALYDFVHDPLLKQNLSDDLPQIRNDMEKHLKAFIQQYHNRMLRNELVIKNRF